MVVIQSSGHKSATILSTALLLLALALSPLASFAQSSVSIVPGSSSKTTDAYSPNPVQVNVGDTVVWTNQDSTPHTATSGAPGEADGMFGGEAGSFGTILAPGKTQEFTFSEAGEYPYFCGLHPNMVGTVIVSASSQPIPAPISNVTEPSTNATGDSLELSEEPFYMEHIRVTNQSQINATILQVSLAGNGTITLPNSTEAIRINSTGTAFIDLKSTLLEGQKTITTKDGSENGTANFYQIIHRDPGTATEKGVVIAIFRTNSTGQLAPLNGMIGVGPSIVQPDGDTDLTLFEWKSGIPLTSDTASG